MQRVLQDAASVGADMSGPVETLLGLGAGRLRNLAQDRFGNYVIQLALRHGAPPQRARLLHELLPVFHELAMGKCGSNVAEAVVEVASVQQLAGAFDQMGPHAADTLRSHQFGAYVMQKIDSRWAELR